jgi:hypothetical protein
MFGLTTKLFSFPLENSNLKILSPTEEINTSFLAELSSLIKLLIDNAVVTDGSTPY